MARGTLTAPFVARQTQVAALRAALDRASDGVPGTVLVGADAGVGKSRLLSHFAEISTEAGATAVTTHCVDLGEVGLPYLPFAEALAQLRTLDGVVDEVVDARPALARLLPSRTPAQDPPGEDRSVRLQLFDGIAEVLGAVGRPGAPLVLIVEDLHWADSSSRDVLRYLVARQRTEHLLVVASFRTDDLHRRHPLRPMLAELWRHPRVERLDLDPFTSTELREFTTAVTGGPVGQATLDSVMARSEGNAYFAEELLAGGLGGPTLPGTLADVLRARVDQLDPAVQRLAQVASVAGRRVAEPLLRAVVATDVGPGLREDELDAALREAVTHHVLVGEDGRMAFRHALLAEVVYGDLLPGEQTTLHRAYLEAMTADPALGPPSSVAAHALRANDLPAALTSSHAAALDAAVVLAPAEELRHLETVLRLWDAVPDATALVGEDRVAVVERTALAAGRAGETERAVALARDAVTSAAPDRARRAPLRAALARHLLGAEREREALTESTAARAELTEQTPPAERAWTLATHARCCLVNDLDEEATTVATLAIEAARAAEVPAAEADALATLAVLVVDDHARTAELLATARRRAREAGDLVTEQRCAYNLATTHYYAGHLEQAAAVLDAALVRTRGAGLAWSEFGVSQRFFRDLVRYARGDLAVDPGWAEPLPESQAALLGAVQQYSAVARGEWDEVLSGMEVPPVWSWDGQVALITGGCTIDALTWAGRHDEAVTMAVDLIDHLGRTWTDYFLGGIWLAALGISALADAAAAERLAGGDPAARVRLGTELVERAIRTADRGRPRGGRLGPEGRAWLARARAEHARLTGEDGVDAWSGAVEAFGYGYRYEEARSRWRWAEALVTAGDRPGAQEQAARAAEEARAMGATPLLEAVHSLARRARLDLPGVRRASSSVLTDREAEVLTLVARGLSNRQIGEQLFISGKTVSVHVSNLLAKLGVAGRAEAVSVAHRRGLIGAD